MTSTLNNPSMKVNRESYVGTRDPWTKQREGSGVFTFSNSFFQYEGSWLHGKKHGHGVLRMKDGTSFEGEFKDGEIEGQGQMLYANGNTYVGSFRAGERDGMGEFIAKIGEKYTGELSLCNGDRIIGGFYENQPHGYCEMYLFGDNIIYKGEMNHGKRHGKGLLIDSVKRYQYEGEFADDKLHGMGSYTFLNLVKDNVYTGNFINDEAEDQEGFMNVKVPRDLEKEAAELLKKQQEEEEMLLLMEQQKKKGKKGKK